MSGDAASNSFRWIKLRMDGPAGTIILQRPEQRNALNRDLIHELLLGMEKLQQTREVRAVILTGAGCAFCAGLDLREMMAVATTGLAQQQWYDDAQLYRQLIDKLWTFPKPVIAAVNGAALGAGLGLVLASDLVLAATEAEFGTPEPLRGIVAGMVAPLLAFRVGGARSAQLLLTARKITAAEAGAWGLLQEVVPAHQLWARSVEWSKKVAQSSPDALMQTKRLLNETIGEALFTQLSAGTAASAASRTTEAAKEGLQAFVEKRSPRWW